LIDRFNLLIINFHYYLHAKYYYIKFSKFTVQTYKNIRLVQQ